MKKAIILFSILLAFLSCKDSSESRRPNAENPEIKDKKESTAHLQTGCYSYDDGNSTVNFEITETGSQVLGNLTYSLAEKDRNTGTFKGSVKDSVLFGDYTFNSEGVESKREVAFKIRDNELVEGYGEMNASGNAFQDKETIKYTSSMPLKKTDCNK